MSLCLTLDVGTTSLKLSLLAPDGTSVSHTKAPTPTVRDDWGEVYEVDRLWKYLVDFVKQLDGDLRSEISKVAVSGVGESGGLVREDLSLASPMILWHDSRGQSELEKISEAARHRIFEITGLPFSPNYGISKIAWAARRSEGEAVWLNISEYIAARLTGRRWAEFSLASRTMALDLSEKAWSGEILQYFGLDAGILPNLESSSFSAPASPDVASQLGFMTTVEVHVAGHDHLVGAVGAGLEEGQMLNSTGTTEGLLQLHSQLRLDTRAELNKLAFGINCKNDKFSVFSSIPTGGSAFATLTSLLGVDALELEREISDLHIDYVNGLVDLSRLPIVLPTFRGSPPPTKSKTTLGVISGLRGDVTRRELIIATFLGLAIQFQEVRALFPTESRVSKVIGPASSNPLWLQLKADMLSQPLSVSRVSDVVAKGAQDLALDRGGDWNSLNPFVVTPDYERSLELNAWVSSISQELTRLKTVRS